MDTAFIVDDLNSLLCQPSGGFSDGRYVVLSTGGHFHESKVTGLLIGFCQPDGFSRRGDKSDGLGDVGQVILGELNRSIQNLLQAGVILKRNGIGSREPGYNLAWSLILICGLIYGFCSSGQSFAAVFLQIPPHDGHP